MLFSNPVPVTELSFEYTGHQSANDVLPMKHLKRQSVI